MSEWFDKIISFIKLPIKYLWVALIFSGFILFAPQSWLDKIWLSKFKTDYKEWLGPLLILSSTLAIIDILHLSWLKIRGLGSNFAHQPLSRHLQTISRP